jgi:predicted nuclease with TOPRIM domain
MECAKPMEPMDPYPHQSIEGQSAGQGISQVQPAQIEPQEGHWLRMDPSLTRAVLAKTEEELLGSLAALMRNKVEHEQASRRFAQIQIDAQQAKHELETVKEHIRRAEVEVATRLNEQSRINEEIVRVRQELAVLRQEHQQHTEIVASLKNEAAQTRQSLDEACRNLSSLKEAAETQLVAHRETIAQLAQVKNEKAALEETLAPLREEVEDRIRAREALVAEAVILHRGVSDLVTHKESLAEEQAHASGLLARKENLEKEVAEVADKHRALHAEVAALETRLQELTEAAGKAEQARIAEGLPLLFGAEAHKIAPEWDPYPLESEFHTDEELDAKKVAELVSMLPGLEGCLIVKNHGPVLASQMPERIHGHLKVPDRNYHLLFERLEKKVEEYNLENARLATFDLGEEALTVAQANHAFVFVNHRQTKLRPGMPGKLASIVFEIAKMYP